MIDFRPIPVLYQIGNFKIYSWGFMFTVAFIVALIFIVNEAKKRKIEEKHIYHSALLSLIGVIIGARIFYVVEHLSHFLNNH